MCEIIRRKIWWLFALFFDPKLFSFFSQWMPYFLFRSPFRTTPTINGKNIDLYLLYWLVTVQGGWEKVSQCAGAHIIKCLFFSSFLSYHYVLQDWILKELTQLNRMNFLPERDRERERQLWYLLPCDAKNAFSCTFYAAYFVREGQCPPLSFPFAQQQ